MDDDKQARGDASPGADAGKRQPPTIDLAASEVTESLRAPDTPDPAASVSDHPDTTVGPDAAPDSESPAASQPSPSRSPSLILPAVIGAAAALLVVGGAKVAGLFDAPAPVFAAASKSDVEALGARIAKIEAAAAKPAPRPVADPAIAARIDTVEKSLASLRGDVVALRGESEKMAAALGDIKSAPSQGVTASEPQTAPVVDTSAIEERLGKIERATAALSAAAAAPQAPVEDPRVRKAAAATLLDSAVRQGEPYAPALAAARAVADNADVLKPLDAFAATGLPAASALSRELLALLPKLAPKPAAQPAPSGMVERLQQSALKLVRIQRTDAAAGGGNATIARAAAAAQRDDVPEAKRELMQLPAADRAPVGAWIAKVDARDAALAASRQFASETMTALSKPAR